MNTLETCRKSIRINHLRDERDVLKNLMEASPLSPALRAAARNNAVDLVRNIRADSRPKLMEAFLAEYGLST